MNEAKGQSAGEPVGATTGASARTASPFRYVAQDASGTPYSGVVEAADADEARWRLTGLGLHLLELSPATPDRRSLTPMRGEDFRAFNEQLASLAEAGLPIERGLRLIARDMRTGRLRRTVERIAEELEKGKPLGEAFDAHRGAMPALYGRLMDIGVKSGNLAGVLFNLGRHMEMMQRLRTALWRAVTYPLVVLVMMAIVFTFIAKVIVPAVRDIVADFGTVLPLHTRVLFWVADRYEWIAAAALVVFVGAPLGLAVYGGMARGKGIIDLVVMRLPLIGPIVIRNLLARWCDAVRLGVESALDLPTAMRMAGEAMGSDRIRFDSDLLASTHSAGQPLQDAVALSVVTPTITAAMDLGMARQDLPRTLATLTHMYEHQAEHRLGVMQATLQPILIILLAVVLGQVIAAIFMPILHLLTGVSGLW